MAEPFLAEIRLTAFSYAPHGWALCNGQLLPINQNQALFALLGTSYGGDGQVNFALPDLRGRSPMHVGNGHSLGERAGTTTTTLSIAHLPPHSHAAHAAAAADTSEPGGAVWASPGRAAFAPAESLGVALRSDALAMTGGSQAHTNMPPYLAVNFVIALQGIFPSQN